MINRLINRYWKFFWLSIVSLWYQLCYVIIPKDILFKHATTNNVQYVSDTGSIFDNRVSCINWPNYFHWF